ncbi:MAG: hypothetical protein U0T79_00405 [Ferruginibacter sp.]
MIKHFTLILALIAVTVTARPQTAQEWQSDLRYLQQKVHSNYSNLFHNISAANWNKAVDDFNTEIPKLNNTQVIAGFVKLLALFHIGHTQMNTWGLHRPAASLSLHRYPFRVYWFSDGLYLVGAESKYSDAVGGKILRIGTMKIEDAMEAIRPLVSCENEQGYQSNAVYFLAIPEFLYAQGIAPAATEVSVTYQKNNKEQTVVFAAGSDNQHFGATGLEAPAGWTMVKTTGATPLWRKEPNAYRYMEYLAPSKTLYVRHSVTLNDGSQSIASFFANMADFIDKNDVQRLILDIRMNGGGNNYLNKPIINSIVASRKINQKGKFFCIIGRRTFSAAQNLVNELEKYTEVTFAGEPTSENVNFYGDTKTEVLPNSKLEANLSWLWWQNLDPRDRRKATSPELAADMRFVDYARNEDPVLKLIQEYDTQKPLMPTLSALIQSGKKEEAFQFAINYLKDPVHRYTVARLESTINDEGYARMQNNRHEEANAFFEINTKLFPESANAYDSYAESFLNMGKKEEAVKYYEMAIAKDKDGVTKENSIKMLHKIRNGQ